MEKRCICLSCEKLCEGIARYLSGKDDSFANYECGSSTETRFRKQCDVCQFLLKTCNRSQHFASPGSELEVVITIEADNHGSLFVQEIPIKDKPRVYLLPLQPSKNSVSGRLYHSLCDPELIRQWLQSCLLWHGPGCYTPGWSEVISPLSTLKVRMIDVRHRCLIYAPVSCRYVALSYVWGSGEVFRTTQSNITGLQRLNGLDEVFQQIPSTITDAIDLVTRIGEKHL